MSRPIELYRFTQGATVWTFTSSDRLTLYEDEDYVPTSIGRSNIEVKNELSKANIEVKMPLSHVTAQVWMKGDLESRIGLTLFSYDLDTGNASTIWKGRLASVKPGTAMVGFLFESVFTSLRRHGLRARYQRPCRHALYQRGCKLVKENFDQVHSLTAIDSTGTILTIPSVAPLEANLFFTGMLKAADGTFRFITGHSGESITISRPIASLTTFPVNVTLYPGCDRTRSMCKTRFDNLNNFGGFSFIPIRNPFDGNSIV